MNIGESFPELNIQNQYGKNIDFKNIVGTKNIVLFFQYEKVNMNE